MKTYKKLGLLVEAMTRGEIPADSVSPGAASQMMGVTRSAISQRVHSGSLEAWTSEGIILISTRSIKAALKKKQGIPESQGELVGLDTQ